MSGEPERVAVVLAAGKGTRMASPLPKVLHPAAGRPLLAWVLEAEQRGTGHALAQAEPHLAGAPATVLVLSGDVPLVTPKTLRELASRAEAEELDAVWGAMAVAELADPGALGRVIADREGNLRKIVEARDATPEEQAIRLVNAGLYALPAPAIFGYLARLTPQNAQGELYLTDALGAAAADGHKIRLLPLTDPLESLGVNNRGELAQVDRLLTGTSKRRNT
jgi:bifunctional UDP-N-acetylglucosamine pyrophosphorylase/glucosamine-1-phosphate N-acetyltransferase